MFFCAFFVVVICNYIVVFVFSAKESLNQFY